MRQLASAFAAIAFRRRGPDSLPDSSFLFFLVLGIYVVANLFALALHSDFSGRRLLLFCFDAALFLAFIYAALRFFRLERRYRRTVTAILGADLVTMALYLPLVMGALGLGLSLVDYPFAVVRVARALWTLFIAAFVIARSLSQPLIVGLMIEALYVLTSLRISYYLIINTTSADSIAG